MATYRMTPARREALKILSRGKKRKIPVLKPL